MHTAQLSNVLNNESLFYTCIIPFVIFFGSFAFVMYPLRDVLHPTRARPLLPSLHAWFICALLHDNAWRLPLSSMRCALPGSAAANRIESLHCAMVELLLCIRLSSAHAWLTCGPRP